MLVARTFVAGAPPALRIGKAIESVSGASSELPTSSATSLAERPFSCVSCATTGAAKLRHATATLTTTMAKKRANRVLIGFFFLAAATLWEGEVPLGGNLHPNKKVKVSSSAF